LKDGQYNASEAMHGNLESVWNEIDKSELQYEGILNGEFDDDNEL
jgi:hypothetical protein